MPDALRVLLVEDNPDDAELVLRALSRGERPVELTRVEDEPSLRAALADGAWDVVIADYALPRFSAPAALAVVQETGLDLPFIVASGTIGEDTAVAMMRSGTHDYLMKDNLTRLLPAVEHEIANAQARRERHEAQAALQESLEQYRSLYDAISGGVIVESAGGEITEANDVACAILGRSPGEMGGHRPDDIDWGSIREDGTPFPRDQHPTAVTLRTGQPTRDVVMGLPQPPDGRMIWILVSSAPILDPATGQVAAAVATFSDITALKEAELALAESQALLTAVVDSTDDMIWSVDAGSFGLLSFNHALSDFYISARGLRVEAGMLPEDLLPTEEHAQQWRELYRRALAEGPHTTERITFTGVPVLQLHVGLLERDGTTYGISVFAKDITERQRAEAALRESEERFRTIFDRSAVGIAVTGAPRRHLDCNPALLEMLGLTRDEFLAMDAAEFTHPEDRHPDTTLWEELVAGQRSSYQRETRYLHKDGRVVWARLTVSLAAFGPDSEPAAIAMVENMSDRKAAEDRLRESEERYRSLSENALSGVYLIQDGRFSYINRAAAAMMGQRPEDLVGTEVLATVHPDDRQRVAESMRRRTADETQIDHYEMTRLHVDGSTRIIEVMGARIDLDGAPALVGTTLDITERKHAEDALRQSEEQYREMFEHMSSGVAVYEAVDDGEDFIFREFNGAAERIEGVDRDALLGRRVTEVFPGAAAMGVLELFRRVWRTGQPEYHPPSLYRDQRHEGWRENFVYRLPAGQVVAIYDDVTERVEAQLALHETSERLQAVIDAAPVAVVMLDASGLVSLWNPAAERIFGWTEEEVLETGFPGGPEGEREFFAAMARQVMEEGGFTDLEMRIPCKDGSEVDVSISGGPVHDAEGKAVAAIGVLADITERTRAARLLQESEERFRRVYEETPIPYQSLDENGHLLEANPAWLDALGYARDEVVGRSFGDFLIPEERALFADRFPRFKEAGGVSGNIFHLVRRDGTRLVTQFEGRVAYNPDGSFRQTHCVFQDITARRAAEEALSAERERLAVTLRSIGDCVIATDVAGRVLLLNSAAAALTGWSEEEAVGRPVDEILRLVDARTGASLPGPVARALGAPAPPVALGRTLLCARDGARYSVAESAAPIHNSESDTVGVVIVFRDVTEEQALRSEALRVQKLESLGVLAGGIAHDFNNVLLVINGNLQMARMFAREDEKHATMLAQAERACLQARDLTQQLLTFAKGGAPVKEVAAIGDLVRDTALFALSGSNVRCEFDLAPDLHTVDVDRGQISQVVNNLVINADQAMPTGGLLRLSLHNTHLDGTGPIPLRAGDYVCLTAADTGTGIPPEHLDRIFDPYFTTKSRGSGLGLASCYSIIQQHGGHLGAESTLGVGSTFRILLPASEREAEPTSSAPRPVPTGTGCILVMDDEAAVRELAELLLTELGYTVALAEDGEQTLAMYQAARERGEPFAAVVLDLTIRGAMGGLETIAALREVDPEVRAVVCSGYSADPVMAQHAAHGFCAVVVKPYEVVELAEAVAHAVNRD